MKKTILTLIFFISVIALSFGQWGNKQGSISGNGNFQTEDRKVSGFDAIAAGDGLDVYIHQTGEEKVTIKAEENLLPIIKTVVKNGTLQIYTTMRIKQRKELRIDVWVKTINELSASGGSDVYSETVIKTGDFQISSSGGSDVELELEVSRLILDASGGSDARLKGKAAQIQLTASGGSDIQAQDLLTGTCKVVTSGGSDAYVNVSDELDITASGGSDVHYKGNARIVNLSVSGASDVHRN